MTLKMCHTIKKEWVITRLTAGDVKQSQHIATFSTKGMDFGSAQRIIVEKAAARMFYELANTTEDHPQNLQLVGEKEDHDIIMNMAGLCKEAGLSSVKDTSASDT
jgi:hypothetical protein